MPSKEKNGVLVSLISPPVFKKAVGFPFTDWVMLLTGHQTISCNDATIWGHHFQL